MGQTIFSTPLKQAIQHCKRYKIKNQRDIQRYLNHMYALDLDFDHNKHYPWAQAILNQADLSSREKLNALSDLTQLALATKKAIKLTPDCIDE